MARSSAASARLKKILSRLSAEARQELRRAIEKGAQDIVESARAFAPPDETGDLRRSIGYTIGRKYRPRNSNVRGVSAGGADHELSATVHAGDEKAFYAAFVEFGTAPHTIRPKRPGGLLNISGRLIERVDHPGASATPFFFPAYRANKRRVTNRVNRAVRKAMKSAVTKR